MASDKQIAANRRNARKSTGPKTKTGKRRASGNAYRHGLSINANLGQNSEAVEALTLRIADNSTDEDILYYGRIAARAHVDLTRIRQVGLDIIERVYRFGALKPAPRFRSSAAELRYLKSQVPDQPLRWPEPIDPLGSMPSRDPDRTAEAVRRLLPELRKLHRYERRAIGMRDHALREILVRLCR